MTERLIVSIVTCDPATGRIEVVGKDAAVIQIGVKPVPVVFRWPKQGETWMIERVNGNWQLGPLVESPDSAAHVEDIQPGEALIQAESLWTPSGEHFIKQSELNTTLSAYVTQTALNARPRISAEFTANSGTLATGVESSAITVVHGLGTVPSVVTGHLEDGAWSHHVGWRVSARTASNVAFIFRNNGPNSAVAILRFRLVY